MFRSSFQFGNSSKQYGELDNDAEASHRVNILFNSFII
jgi:hypothetical protein